MNDPSPYMSTIGMLLLTTRRENPKVKFVSVKKKKYSYLQDCSHNFYKLPFSTYVNTFTITDSPMPSHVKLLC